MTEFVQTQVGGMTKFPVVIKCIFLKKTSDLVAVGEKVFVR